MHMPTHNRQCLETLHHHTLIYTQVYRPSCTVHSHTPTSTSTHTPDTKPLKPLNGSKTECPPTIKCNTTLLKVDRCPFITCLRCAMGVTPIAATLVTLQAGTDDGAIIQQAATKSHFHLEGLCQLSEVNVPTFATVCCTIAPPLYPAGRSWSSPLPAHCTWCSDVTLDSITTIQVHDPGTFRGNLALVKACTNDACG